MASIMCTVCQSLTTLVKSNTQVYNWYCGQTQYPARTVKTSWTGKVKLNRIQAPHNKGQVGCEKLKSSRWMIEGTLRDKREMQEQGEKDEISATRVKRKNI